MLPVFWARLIDWREFILWITSEIPISLMVALYIRGTKQKILHKHFLYSSHTQWDMKRIIVPPSHEFVNNFFFCFLRDKWIWILIWVSDFQLILMHNIILSLRNYKSVVPLRTAHENNGHSIPSALHIRRLWHRYNETL